jgi:hypothetical protein
LRRGDCQCFNHQIDWSGLSETKNFGVFLGNAGQNFEDLSGIIDFISDIQLVVPELNFSGYVRSTEISNLIFLLSISLLLAALGNWSQEFSSLTESFGGIGNLDDSEELDSLVIVLHLKNVSP